MDAYIAPCFYNVNFFLFGFNQQTVKEMKTKIMSKRGQIVSSPERADILILKSGLYLTPSEKTEIEKYQSKIATEFWFDYCFTSDKFVPISERKDFSINVDFIFSGYSRLYPKLLSNESTTKRQKKKETYNLNLFYGKTFFISRNYDEKSRIQLFQLISVLKGFISEHLSQGINYFITSDANEYKDLISLFKEVTKPIFVTFDWIFDSIDQKVLLDPKLYAPPSKDKKLNEIINDPNIESNRRNVILGEIFKGKYFTFIDNTYDSKEEIQEIKTKITENAGTICSNCVDSSDNIKADYLICNDGNGKLIADVIELINKPEHNNKRHILVSHRFITRAIDLHNLNILSENYDIFPLNFKVPVEYFTKNNLKFYVPSSQYQQIDKAGIEHLIDTLGGIIECSKDTNFIVIKDKDISNEQKEKYLKKSNPNAKIIFGDFLLGILASTGPAEIEESFKKVMEGEDIDM
ncbi:MAG: hypothetical protein MJ252_14310 [archaeon]|nr:hypothetical protein [archaeon]